MEYLSSFAAYLGSTLPTLSLDALPTVWLPRDLQRRVLSFILRRALGGLVKTGGLDAERLDLGLRAGSLVIDALDLNEEAIDRLIPDDVPLRLSSGSLGTLSVKIPWPSSPFSSSNSPPPPLAVSLSHLHLRFSLVPSSATRAGRATSNSTSRDPAQLASDISRSVASVVDEFYREELDKKEEQDLLASILTLRADADLDPFLASPSDEGADLEEEYLPPGSIRPFLTSGQRGSAPGAAKKEGADREVLPSMIDDVVNGLLARLQVEVKDVRITVDFEGHVTGGTEQIELRLGSVSYSDERSGSVQGPQPQMSSSTSTSPISARTARAASVSLNWRSSSSQSEPAPVPAAAISTSTLHARPRSQSRAPSSYSSTSSSSDDEDVADKMLMSMAVADLRQSAVTEEGGSMYESATGGDSFFDASSQSNLPEEPPASPPVAEWQSLATFGDGEIVLRLTTSLASVHPRRASNSSSTRPSSMRQVSSSSTSTQSSLSAPDLSSAPRSTFECTLPPLSVLLSASRCRSLTSLLSQALPPRSTAAHPPHPAPSAAPPPPCGPSISATLRLQSVLVILVYDEETVSAASEPSFWVNPSGGRFGGAEIEFKAGDLLATWYNHTLDPRRANRPSGLVVDGAARPSPSRVPSTSSRITSSSPRPSGIISPAVVPPLISVISLTVGTISLLEHLPSASVAPSLAVAPILIFDPNLPAQYDPTATFPSFECQDWRSPNAAARVGESWQVRPGRARTGGAFGGAGGKLKGSGLVGDDVQAVLSLAKAGNEGATLFMQPLHLFLDLSLVDRLLPFLRSLAPSPSPGVDLSPSSSVSLTPPLPSNPLPPPLRRTRTVIEDLDDDSERAGLPSTPLQSSTAPVTPALSITCPLLRAEIRCPAPASFVGLGNGESLRSGIVVVDVHEISLNVAAAPKPASLPPPSSASTSSFTPSLSLTSRKAGVFFSRVAESRAKAFLVIDLPSAADSHNEALDGPPLLPSIKVFSSVGLSLARRRQRHSTAHSLGSRPASPRSSVELFIPSVRANIHQSTVEGLEYFADDVTRWLDGAFEDLTRPKPRDDLKLIGSRFFGPGYLDEDANSPHGLSAPSKEPNESAVISLEILEVDVLVHAPRTRPTSFENGSPVRVMHLSAYDIDIIAESSSQVKESVVSLAIGEILVEDVSSTPIKLVSKTYSRSPSLATKAAIALRLTSTSELDGTSKETGVQAVVNNCTTFVTPELGQVAADLAAFAKTPEGAFEDVVPSEMTRIAVRLEETSLHLVGPALPGALVVCINSTELSTELSSTVPGKAMSLAGRGVRLFAVDDVKAPIPDKYQGAKATSSSDHWKHVGFAPMLELARFDLAVRFDPDANPHADISLSNVHAKVTACADSVVTLGGLFGDVAKILPSSSSPVAPPAPISTSPDERDLLSSLDEAAFLGREPIAPTDDVDFANDADLPRNLEFLDYQKSSARPTSEDISSFEDLGAQSSSTAPTDIVSEVNGETVRLLDPRGLQLVEDYWIKLARQGAKEQSLEPIPTTLRFRLSDSNVSILLHDGFDWHHTRKTIEDEVKTVRRRLEKIRQLVASGQTPDESVEEAGVTLFNSIYVGPSQYSGGLDSSGFLAPGADDDDLLHDFGDDASQASSFFQPVQGRSDRAGTPPVATASRIKKTRKLTRSKGARIEINLTHIRTEFVAHPIGSELASRVCITVRDVEILDHIKTSTWKKFLTELKSDSRGNVREAGSHMVSIELRSVRPIASEAPEEGRLRVKILPLRLHVDQDARDFLERFGMFKDSRPPPPPVISPPPSSSDLYFQHVEIFPVQLKLDYKPKRVDYKALREGKTTALMNFIHLDAADITLRRITLSGITGISRILNTLNDLWTPDVKANQLVDIISGVTPIRSLVNVGSGVADLILLPIEQYKKDGRLARGIQRGTTSFAKSTALEALGLGAKLATGTQVILERAEGALSGRFSQPITIETLARDGTDGRTSSDDEGEDEISRYANQPLDVKEGITTAYKSLSRNMNSAAETILAVPMEVYERSGTDGPVRAVVRAIPVAVLKPMIGASEAVSKTLFGIRNSIDPNARQERDDKYK